MSLLVEMPDMGLNSLVPPSELDMRNAAEGSQNLIYQYGIMRTPYGFAKVDLTTTGLNSGDKVLAVFGFTEEDGTDHLIAVTTEKIYEHDRINSRWNDLTQSGVTMNSDIWHPISYVSYRHESWVYLDDDTSRERAYHHLIVCDGGMSNIQRWAGKNEADFADVIQVGGYGTGQTTHRALQVGTYMNHLLLIAPQEYDSSTKIWAEIPQRVRWSGTSFLETWSTASDGGFVDLVETNDDNVWSGLLGNQYIIYQRHSIWGLNYIGGTGSNVFKPFPVIESLGLLSHHLFVSHNNVHYFVGDDFNVYKYFGGSVKLAIGDKIHKNLREDLNPDYASRCWMTMGAKGDYLWIFIVPSGSEYVTMAYGMNMKTESWMIRDFTHKWSTGGITAVGLVGGQSYTVGDTYATALNTLSPYDAADDTATTAGDVTEKYGDVLYDNTGQVVDWTTIDSTLDVTTVEFSEGGLFFEFTTKDGDPTAILRDDTGYADWSVYSGKIMRIEDGSVNTNMNFGTHYYTLTDVSSTADGTAAIIRVSIDPRDTTGNAVADESANVPSLDASSAVTVFDPSGETYRQKLEERHTDDALVFGDSNGFVYQEDFDMTSDDGEDMEKRHVTPVLDGEAPDIYKRWSGLAVVGKGSSMNIQYRISNFDTSETGWTNIS